MVTDRVDFFCEKKLKKDFGAAICYFYTHIFWPFSGESSI